MAMDRGLTGAHKVTLDGLSLANCMEACIRHANGNCTAVASGYRTRTCYLFDSTRTTPGVTFTSSGYSGYEYAERFFNGLHFLFIISVLQDLVKQPW